MVTRPTNPGRAALFAIFSTQSNDFAIGYPMISALYGSTHPEYSAYLYLMAPISLAILNPIGFILLEIGKGRAAERSSQPQSRMSMMISVFKGIALNPILFMTVLGIIGNFVFSHSIPVILSVILDVFGNAFSASALFLLGLMMVGKVHTLKGAALVIPGILILIKLLALPLVIRESVILLNAGVNETDTRDLSTYGFLYGTIPTAPALFIFTLRYNLDIDLIASAMVACTFISAPLMFVSAKLITAINKGVSPDNYARQLNTFSMDISAASIAACIWLLICFFILEGKKYKRPTHRSTLCIIMSQLMIAIGVIIWTKLEVDDTGSLIWYLQFVLITGGVYSSRLCTAAMAATLLFINSRSTNFVNDLQKWILPTSFILPLAIITLMCTVVSPEKPIDKDMRNPNFQMASVEGAVSIFILLFSFIVTVGCLVLHQRHQRRNNSEVYASLISNTAESTTNDETPARSVVDVEDLIPPTTNNNNLNTCGLENGNCILQRSLCAAANSLMDECEPEDSESMATTAAAATTSENEDDDPQLLRHLVFLIFLLCSMFVGLVLSIGTMIMEQLTGVYAELAFLDIAFNYGQGLIAFGIFGLDPSLGRLGMWLKKICHDWRARQKLQLPDEDSLSPEARRIREQFKRCHLQDCKTRISVCRRRLLKVYEGVFTGSDLVDWLLDAGIAHNRDEAVRYGRCLLDSRVLYHIEGTHHFQDKNILYTFRS
uniref:DEP domain-containing protein n=1 Tax=Bracon brevicornis TaxID=1563983 RepID=A0A6V7LQ70_9HYME